MRFAIVIICIKASIYSKKHKTQIKPGANADSYDFAMPDWLCTESLKNESFSIDLSIPET